MRKCWLAVFLFAVNNFLSAQCVIPVTATGNPVIVCPGQLVELRANALPVACGPTVACVGNNVTQSIGNGNTAQPGTATQAPSLLGNFTKSGRNQMLYRKTELTPQLGGPCVLRNVSFNVAIFNSNAFLQNFTIKMGCTSDSTLSTWNNNLTTVYTSANPFQPQAGWINSVVLTTPFAWDGVSNLIVDVCWYNPSTFGSQNNKAECTSTAPLNTYLYAMGNTDQCGTVAAPGISSLRPNIKFNYCTPDINDYNISWTPYGGGNPNGVTRQDSSYTTAHPLVSTNYIINVNDGLGCTGADTVVILVDTSHVSAGPDINSCPGFNNQLTAVPVGLVIPGPPAFSWRTLTGTNLGTGVSINVAPTINTSYEVTMTGGFCPQKDTVNITISGLTVNANVTNITCNGANNGKIKVTSNGVAPLTFLWSGNAGTGNVDSAKNLIPGTYTVTVTDAQGCSGSASATITQPAAVTLTQSITNVYCNGGNNGQLIVRPAGGTGNVYNFNWNNGLPNNDTVSNLLAGAYSVTVTDVNGCSAVGNYTVSQPPVLVFNAPQTKNIRCLNGNDGFITVSVSGGSGGYVYDWSHDSQLHQPNATNLPAGTYTITVTDAANCSLTVSYVLTQPLNGITFNAPTVVNASCFGYSNGSITANPTGGAPPYVYAWNTTPVQNTQTATGLSAQSYTVSVTDDSLCTSTASIAVNEPPQISIAAAAADAQCFNASDGAIDVTVTNGVNPLGYAWNYNAITTQDLSAIPAGNYSITVTDNTSCSQTASFVIAQPAQLVLNPAAVINVSCFGGSNGTITANPDGGTMPYSYVWNPNMGTTQTISSLSANTYDLTVTDLHNCSATDSYAVTEPPVGLSFGAATVVNVLCNGLATGSITVAPAGGTGAYTYSWSQEVTLNSATASSLPANTYTTTVTDANGCSLSTTNTIIEPAAVTFGAQNITNVNCAGGADGTAQISPSGGTGAYSYSWNGTPGSNPQAGLAANSYNVVVVDANSCSFSTTVVVTEPTALSVTLTPHDVNCAGGSDGSVDAFVSGGTPAYFYAWSNGNAASSITLLVANSYAVTITDSHACTISMSTNVNQPGVLGVNATSTQVTCSGSIDGTITAVANGGTPGFTYTLSQNGNVLQTNTNGNFSGLNTGNYTVDVVDANGCPVSTPIFIPAPVADAYTYTVDSTSCFGSNYTDGAIHVDGQPAQNQPFTYGVDNGPLGLSGDFFGLAAGDHVVTGRNNWGCITQIPVTIPEPQNGVADVFPHDTTIQLGESIQLYSTFSPFPASTINSYNWTPSLALNCIDCANPLVTPFKSETQYTLTITYNDHCVATAGMTILVENHLQVFIPNSFSPNGDGNNEEFRVYGEGIKMVDLKVFNRWGEMVFETHNQLEGWDGTFKGELQTPSVFAYWVKITYLDDKKIDRVGSVTLIR